MLKATPALASRHPIPLRLVSRLTSSVVVLLGCIAMAGWTFNLPALRSGFPGLTAMNPATALLFIATGICLRIRGTELTLGRRSVVSDGLLAVVAMIAALRLAGYVFRFDWGPDRLLFMESLEGNRMAPATAICFLINGVAFFISRRPTPAWIGQTLSLSSLLFSLVAALGYLYNAEELYRLGPYTPIALPTALGLAVCSVFVLLDRPDEGWLAALRRRTGRSFLGAHAFSMGFGAAVLMLAGLALLIHSNTSGLLQEVKDRRSTFDRLSLIADIDHSLLTAEAARRAYGLSGKTLYKQRFDTVAAGMPGLLYKLSTGTFKGSSPEPIAKIETLLNSRFTMLDRHVRDQEAGRASGIAPLDIEERQTNEIESLLAQLRVDQSKLLFERDAAIEVQSQRVMATVLIGGIVAVGLIVLVIRLLGNEITQRKIGESRIQALNNELRLRAAGLEAANQELEAFSYSVSHDLRAPLRSIDGFSLAVIEDYADKLDDEGRANLQRIRAASQRMARLIDDLLNLSRLARAKMTRQEIDLSSMADEIVRELRRLEPHRRVDVKVAPGLRAWGDEPLIRIVVQNLLANAWKYTGKTENPVIEMGETEVDRKACFFVKDNGVGFDMAYAGKLFGPFQRLHRQEEFEGTGVGLATVKRILHRHGGEVWTQAELGKGATFYFTL
jgi:signal transduction histidine kinase